MGASLRLGRLGSTSLGGMQGKFRPGDHLHVRRRLGYYRHGIYIGDGRVIRFGGGVTLQLRLDEVQELSCRAIHGIRPRHIFACVDDDGVIRKEKPSQWPSIRRGHALSAVKALGSR